ncbi:hypothetical protein Lal_00039584 [Lupinus albus]|nr:hypothetical protein Lal_00039584 [Lupinus albus]
MALLNLFLLTVISNDVAVKHITIHSDIRKVKSSRASKPEESYRDERSGDNEFSFISSKIQHMSRKKGGLRRKKFTKKGGLERTKLRTCLFQVRQVWSL